MEASFAGSERYFEIVAGLEDQRREFEYSMSRIERFRGLGPDSAIFEVGVGTGWFLILCAQRGLPCSGIELNPLYIAHARELAARYGVEFPITRGSIESTDIGEDLYDVVFASSVFEHVERVDEGLANVHRALKPGGILYFYSTNKFSFRSGEYPQVPLYGWLPYALRRRIRVSRQGPAIVDNSGIDFNQFTYRGLRRRFKRAGFSRVLDMFEFTAATDLLAPSPLRRAVFTGRHNPLRSVARVFGPGTCFICVK